VGPVDLGGHTALAVSAGGTDTCAILNDHTVRCWGFGGDGELGYGAVRSVLSPSSVGPVDLGPGRTAVAISAGGDHTCASLDNGSALCWGDNTYGQLGYGSTSSLEGKVSDPGSGRSLNGLACPAATQCTAVDGIGRSATFNPAAPGTPAPVPVDGVANVKSV